MAPCWLNNFQSTREHTSVKLNVRRECSSRQNCGCKQLPQFYKTLYQTLRCIFFFIFYQVCRSWCAVTWDFEWTVWRQGFFNFWDLKRGEILGCTLECFHSVLFKNCGTPHTREHKSTPNDSKGIPPSTGRLDVVPMRCSPVRGTVSLVLLIAEVN